MSFFRSLGRRRRHKLNELAYLRELMYSKHPGMVNDAYANQNATYPSAFMVIPGTSNPVTGTTPPVPPPPPCLSFGASLSTNGTINITKTASLFSTSNFRLAMLDSGVTHARWQMQWASIERPVQTTSSTAIAPGSVTITVTSWLANFVNGATIDIEIDSNSKGETVTLTAVNMAGSTITATFANSHSGTYMVSAHPANGSTPGNSGSPATVLAYDWSILDDYVIQCKTDGIFPVFVLQNAPPWHQTPLAIDASKNVPVAADAATFATAVMQRVYNTDNAAIGSFEVANEGFNTGLLTANNASQMFSQMNTLLSTVRPAVKAVSSSTIIGAPAELNAQTANINVWIPNFFSSNCYTFVDYVNFHFYPQNGPDNPITGNSGLQQWLAAWSSGLESVEINIPVWMTESGWTIGVIGDAAYSNYLNTMYSDFVAFIDTGPSAVFFLYDLDAIVPAKHFNDGSTNQSYKTWKANIAATPRC